MYITPVTYQTTYWPEYRKIEQKEVQPQTVNQTLNINDKVELTGCTNITINLYGIDGKLKEIVK